MPEPVPNETKTSPVGKLLASDPYSRTIGERWKRNRGTQLLAFAVLIFITGTLVLLYSQSRFVPVEFPGDDAFKNSNARPSADAGNLTESTSITVTGAANDRGVLRIAIYNKAEGFNDLASAARRASAAIENGESKMPVSADLLADSFAIAVFHDENENGSLDRNGIGIPTERYGFSNNARGLMGPPSFDDAKIDRPEAGQSIEISIR